MNLETGIEIVEGFADSQTFTPTWQVDTALKLLVKAGKSILEARQGNPPLDGELLPGETDP